MKIDFSESSPNSQMGSMHESLVSQALRQRAEADVLLKILTPEKKEDKKDEKKGLTKKQVFWIMMGLSLPIGWVVSTIMVLSALGIKNNLNMLLNNFN